MAKVRRMSRPEPDPDLCKALCQRQWRIAEGYVHPIQVTNDNPDGFFSTLRWTNEPLRTEKANPAHVVRIEPQPDPEALNNRYRIFLSDAELNRRRDPDESGVEQVLVKIYTTVLRRNEQAQWHLDLIPCPDPQPKD